MKQRIPSLFGMGTAIAFLSLSSLTTMSAQTVAYNAVKQAGNQGWTGNLGLDFNVNSPIRITALGAFNSNSSSGFAGTIQVAIFNRTTMTQVPGASASLTGTTDPVTAGDRFHTLATPIVLLAGEYSIVAVGFSGSDLNGNTTITAPSITPSTEHPGSGGLISFVGTGRYDGNGTLDFPATVPSGTPSNVFLAGTFEFEPAVPADTFVTPTQLTDVTYPEALTVGDFNTGSLSIAVANWGSANVAVLLNNGSGTFTLQPYYPVGNNPKAITTGEFFGNGKTDLAVANYTDGTVSILKGESGGGFTPFSTPASAGTSPYSIATGFFNKDKNLDLVVANDNLGVTMLLGNGNGTFQTQPMFVNASVKPSSLTVADFDQDGCLDVAVANPALLTVSVLFGNCNGSFSKVASVSSPLFERPFFITTGYFNGDLLPDVAVTDYDGQVYVMTGTGKGNASSGAPFNLPSMGYVVGEVPTSIAVGDVNADGLMDLVVTNSYSADISVLLGNGNGTFQNAVPYTAPSMTLPGSVALGVFNASTGVTDAAVADFYSGVTILLGKK